MDNQIMRVVEKNGFIVYKRLGNKKNFKPLSLYFVVDSDTGEYTGQDFKSITQVNKFKQSLD